MNIELGKLTILGFVQITGIHICVITYFINIGINIFLVKYNNRKVSDVIYGILLYSVFILTWIPINLISICSKENKWEQIIHTRSIGIKDIIKE